jgi:hypothetical protein
VTEARKLSFEITDEVLALPVNMELGVDAVAMGTDTFLKHGQIDLWLNDKESTPIGKPVKVTHEAGKITVESEIYQGDGTTYADRFWESIQPPKPAPYKLGIAGIIKKETVKEGIRRIDDIAWFSIGIVTESTEKS